MGSRTAPVTPDGGSDPSPSDGRALTGAASTSDRAIGSRRSRLSRKLAIVVIGGRARLLAIDPTNRSARRDTSDQGHGEPELH